MLEMVDLRQRQKGALAAWLKENKTLYPSRSQKQTLADLTDMSYIQVSRWFANRRRKVKSISAITTEPQLEYEKFDDSLLSLKPESPDMTPPLQTPMGLTDHPGFVEQQKETPVSPELLQLILLQSLLAQQALTFDPQTGLNFDPNQPPLSFDPPPQVHSPLPPPPPPAVQFPQQRPFFPPNFAAPGILPEAGTVRQERVPPPQQLELNDLELVAVSVLTEFAARQKRG